MKLQAQQQHGAQEERLQQSSSERTASRPPALRGCQRAGDGAAQLGVRSVLPHGGDRQCSVCSSAVQKSLHPAHAPTWASHPAALQPLARDLCANPKPREHSTAAHSSGTAAAALSPACRAALTVHSPRCWEAPTHGTGPDQSAAITVCPQALPHRAVLWEPLLPSHWWYLHGGLPGRGREYSRDLQHPNIPAQSPHPHSTGSRLLACVLHQEQSSAPS